MTNRNPETTQFTGDAGTGNLAGGSSNNNLLPPPDTSGGNGDLRRVSFFDNKNRIDSAAGPVKREVDGRDDNGSDLDMLQVTLVPVPEPNIFCSDGVFKSGPLFLSSMNGLGWTTWKKRWFILTRTSLVFFRSDPSAIPQRGSEANLTLGGIDLNNSGSVVLKADKKLLTVAFNDGGSEGRTFTLKAETTEDLYEWKNALESALAQAPSASLATGQDGVLNESDSKNGSSEQTKDRQPAKSTVIGRPILLALEEVDGSPSFLEKALRFIEEKGVRVEGILRQAADVEHVEHRIREYEQGKTEFVLGEDAHVIADCVKYIIRELPSHAVPTSCCNALLDACRKSAGANRRVRINSFREAICESFPEPNRRLLQRILEMMQVVASHKNENLMSSSAVAACMAPLLLRPLLLGECELDNDFDVGGDGSMQLLQAAAAANHAQAIVITLLEEYPRIFGEGDVSPELYTDSDVSGSEEVTDDDDELDDLTGESDEYSDEEIEIISSGTGSGSYESDDDEKDLDVSNSGSKSPTGRDKLPSKSGEMSIGGDAPKHEDVPDQQDASTDTSSIQNIENQNQYPTSQECDSEMKSLSLEPIDYDFENETDVQKLEATIADLQNKVAREVKANDILLANMRKRKKALQKQCLDLEREVVKLQDQLQKERDTNTALEAVLKNPSGPLPNLSNLDDKTKAELQELAQAESDVISLKQKADSIGMKLNQPPESSKDENDSDSKADTAQSSSSKSGLELAFGKFNQGNLKRSNARGEGGGNTNTPLNKLGTRLNFLKEWRSQIANELQNMEKGRSSGQSGTHKSEKRQGSGSDQNPGKRQGSASDQNPGKRQGSGSASQPEQNPGK